jgi:uncharacterized protein YndB with AHSA1/START domain
MTESIRIDQTLPHPPERVWRAITTPSEVETWWVKGNISTTVGAPFLLEMPGWGNVECTVLEAHEPERFAYSFGDWTLTWTLSADDSGTVLTLEHAGFDLARPDHQFAFENMGPGWRDQILPRLATVLNETD